MSADEFIADIQPVDEVDETGSAVRSASWPNKQEVPCLVLVIFPHCASAVLIRPYVPEVLEGNKRGAGPSRPSTALGIDTAP